LGWAGLGWLIVALLIFNMATDEDSSSAVLVGESLGTASSSRIISDE